MFTVAVTGSIASGKSTVADYFSALGVDVIDADDIAHRLMSVPNVLQQVVAYFGSAVLTTDQQVDRCYLRNIIFSDSKARDFLEQLLHPLIYKRIHESILKAKSTYCLLIIPLLFQENTAHLVREKPTSGIAIPLNRIMLVVASRALQVQRAQQRDQTTKKHIEFILSLQNFSQKKLNIVNDIIYNKTTCKHLSQCVKRFHRIYLALAQAENKVLASSAFPSYYLVVK